MDLGKIGKTVRKCLLFREGREHVSHLLKWPL